MKQGLILFIINPRDLLPAACLLVRPIKQQLETNNCLVAIKPGDAYDSYKKNDPVMM